MNAEPSEEDFASLEELATEETMATMMTIIQKMTIQKTKKQARKYPGLISKKTTGPPGEELITVTLSDADVS